MKHLDEYRDAETARRLAASIHREADTRPPLSPDGILRRPYACDLPLRHRGSAAHEYRDGAWPRLPGLRAADRPARHGDPPRQARRRHSRLLWRHAAGARLQGSEPVESQGGRRRHPHGLFHARRGEAGASQSGPRGDLLRHRIRDHDPADRARDRGRCQSRARELFGVLQSRTDPIGNRRDPRGAGGARARRCRDRRLPRAGACLGRHRQPALRVLRRGVPQAGRHLRLRADRYPAIDPDAGAAAQRGPRRGREPVYPRGHPRRQSARQAGGVARIRAAARLRMARPRPHPLFGAPSQG